MGRKILIAGQVLATILFVYHFDNAKGGHWAGWVVPMLLIVLVAFNSVRPNRFTCWLIFAIAFFCFLTVLSAFTMRWRAEPGFNSLPFYRAMGMYVLFIYVSLGQLKIYVGGGNKPKEIS